MVHGAVEISLWQDSPAGNKCWRQVASYFGGNWLVFFKARSFWSLFIYARSRTIIEDLAQHLLSLAKTMLEIMLNHHPRPGLMTFPASVIYFIDWADNSFLWLINFPHLFQTLQDLVWCDLRPWGKTDQNDHDKYTYSAVHYITLIYPQHTP